MEEGMLKVEWIVASCAIPFPIFHIRHSASCYHTPVSPLPDFLLVPLLAFTLGVAAHVIAIRTFPRMGLLDFPERYGLKRRRLPYPTGILSVGLFIFIFGFIEPFSMQSAGLIAGIAGLGIASFIDDRRPLPAGLRLGVQIAVSLLIFLTGTRIFSLTNPLDVFFPSSDLPLDRFTIPSVLFKNPSVLGALFTVAWLGLTVNALNWFDGVRGQVSVISVIGFLTIGALSLSMRVNDPHLAMLAFVLANLAAAALIFDFPPGRVILGDTGAMFFGLMLGVLTIYAGGKVATGFLVLGVPLIDSLIVVTRRIRHGRNPFKGAAQGEHLHHRLLAKGWSERQVIALTASMGTAFGIAALFMDTLQKVLAALVLFGIMLCLSIYSRDQNLHEVSRRATR